jgi:hypothetical protein
MKAKSKRGGARPGAGRKALGFKRINIMVADSHIDKAKRIGNQNVSLGVRKALDRAED